MQRKQLWILAIIAALVLGLSLWWVLGSDELGEAGDDAIAEQGEGGAEGGEPGRDGPRFATPELEREPRSAVAGIVRGEGEPVAGARVCVWAQDRDRLAGRDPKNPRCTLSEADGHYRIEGLWPVSSEVHASAEGFIPAKWSEDIEGVGTSYAVLMRPGEERGHLDFDLRRGGAEVRGVVKDIAGGEIEGAVVWVRPSGFVIDKGSAMGVTDENGAFRLWAAEGRARVGAKVEGYADAKVNTMVPGPTVEVFMVPESAISGRVVYAGSGEPAAGVEIEAGASRFFGGGQGTTRSDEQGKFRVGGLEAGVYTLSARGDEVYGEGGELVHLGLAETEEGVIVEVHPARHVEGEIVIADGGEGRPCEVGGVELIDRGDKERRIRSGVDDRDGKVSVGAVLPGTYEVKVNCQGYVSEDSYEDLVVGEDNLVGLKWEVREGLAMRGVVVDGAGEPVEGVTVYAKMRPDADDPRKRIDRDLARPSDVEGNFEILGVLPGTYELDVLDMDRFGSSGEDPLVVELEPGADINDLRMELPARGAVFGTIRDAQGEPVSGAIVRATPVGSWGGPRSISDDGGAFRIEEVDTGELRVTASDGRMTLRAPGTSDDDDQGELVKVVAGEEAEVNLVVEAQGASIRGQVLDEGGAPVSDAFVSAQRMTDSVTAGKGAGKRRIRWSFNNQPVLTDQDGRFVIDDLSADASYVIGAFRKGGGEAVEEGVQSGGEVELTIVDTGELAGKVVVEGGEAPERFTVTVNNRDEGLQRSDELFRTGGAFRMKELPPGTYEVQVKSPSGSASVEDIELEGGEVRDDLVLKLQPRVTVRGRFVDLDTGEPVPGMRASIGPRTGPMTFFGEEGGDQKDVSGADGAFVVAEAVSGKVRLTARPRNFTKDAKYSWTSILLEIPADAGEHDLGDIELVADRVENSDAGDLGYELKQADIGTKSEDQSLEVALVREGGPAQAAGLEVGAVIERVDGHSVVGEDRYRYSKLVSVPKGTTVKLGLKGGESVEITAGPPRD